MSPLIGALLFGLTVALLALSVKPPPPRLRHEPVKERAPRRDLRRRARFRVRGNGQRYSRVAATVSELTARFGPRSG
jgi:hypothetical protein